MKLLPVVLFGFAAQFASAQLSVSPQIITLPRDSGHIIISDGRGAQLKFKYGGVENAFNAPNFIVVIPSSGTTPSVVRIGLNSNVVAQLQPGGRYSLTVTFVTVDQTPESKAGSIVELIVPQEPPPSVASVVNAASLQPLLSPGALVSIIGSHLTGPTQSTNYDDTASYPTSVAGTSVTFNGIDAPLLYVSPGQINAIVPFALAGQKSVQVVVQRFNLQPSLGDGHVAVPGHIAGNLHRCAERLRAGSNIPARLGRTVHLQQRGQSRAQRCGAGDLRNWIWRVDPTPAE
jgi:hypothetical protein